MVPAASVPPGPLLLSWGAGSAPLGAGAGLALSGNGGELFPHPLAFAFLASSRCLAFGVGAGPGRRALAGPSLPPPALSGL